MSLGSDTARCNSLAACYGDNKSSLWPSSVTLRMYFGDPTDTGVELDGTGGYAGVVIATSTAVMGTPTGAGLLANATDYSFPLSSGAWQYVPDHWAFTDGSGNLLDTGFIGDTYGVTDANQIARFAAGSLVIEAA